MLVLSKRALPSLRTFRRFSSKNAGSSSGGSNGLVLGVGVTSLFAIGVMTIPGVKEVIGEYIPVTKPLLNGLDGLLNTSGVEKKQVVKKIEAPSSPVVINNNKEEMINVVPSVVEEKVPEVVNNTIKQVPVIEVTPEPLVEIKHEHPVTNVVSSNEVVKEREEQKSHNAPTTAHDCKECHDHKKAKPVEIVNILPPMDDNIGVVSSEVRAKQLYNSTVDDVLEDMSKQSIALRRELEATLLKDLQELDENALRIRVAQLAAEFFERNKWEALRLHNSLKQVEADVTKRYLDLMMHQRAELELEFKKKLVKREQELNEFAALESSKVVLKLDEQLRNQADQLRATREEELAAYGAKLQEEFNSQMSSFMANVRNNHVKDQLETQANLQQIKGNLDAIHQCYDEIISTKSTLDKLNQQAAAMLALEYALSTSRPIEKELSYFKSITSDDALVTSLLNAIPANVSKVGALTESDLRSRFTLVKNEVRRVSKVPEGVPAMVGYSIGSVLAYVTSPPHGKVDGDGVEESLSRASYYLDSGLLREALKELDTIQGQPRKFTSDWEKAANERIVVDQIIKALKANTILRYTNK